jgi:hypothetical protein
MVKFNVLPKSKNIEDARVSELYGTNKDIPREDPIDGILNAREAKRKQEVVKSIGDTFQAKTTPSQSNKEYKQDAEDVAGRIRQRALEDILNKYTRKGK